MKPGTGRKAKFHAKNGGGSARQERKMVRTLDALAEFEVFDATILPQLKKAVLEQWPPERMRKVFAPLMQGIMIKKGLEGNFKAIKDTLDRHEGTAIQRVEQKTIYAHMSKKELAALALQKLRDANMIEIDPKTGEVITKVKKPDDED